MKVTGEQLLELTLDPFKNAAGARTLRAYFQALLRKLLVEGEGFSGKRPFGESSWQYELYRPMIVAGLVKGKLDLDGYVEELDLEEADRMLLAAVAAL